MSTAWPKYHEYDYSQNSVVILKLISTGRIHQHPPCSMPTAHDTQSGCPHGTHTWGSSSSSRHTTPRARAAAPCQPSMPAAYPIAVRVAWVACSLREKWPRCPRCPRQPGLTAAAAATCSTVAAANCLFDVARARSAASSRCASSWAGTYSSRKSARNSLATPPANLRATAPPPQRTDRKKEEIRPEDDTSTIPGR